MWRHTRRGDKYITMIIGLTAVRAGTGAARLLAMVEGRVKQAFKTWLPDRDQTWHDGLDDHSSVESVHGRGHRPAGATVHVYKGVAAMCSGDYSVTV